MKIAHSFKFSDKVTKALAKLAKIPSYGSKTGVIEALVWEKACELSIVKSPGCNNNRNTDNDDSKTTA
jgi:hypothetical protein